MKKIIIIIAGILVTTNLIADANYPVVDTNQNKFFDNKREISKPNKEDYFYGQDAQYTGNIPSYTHLSDGNVLDNVTNLVWQKSYEVLSYNEALDMLNKLNKEDQKNEWRLPTIKELYSLMDFSGVDASSHDMDKVEPSSIPFIDTEYFEFEYGSNGDRIIDTQLLSSSIYQGKTMEKDKTVFGLNVADGRIKGYPLKMRGEDKKYTVRFVSGNQNYGINDFYDNNDKTITDRATNLMWSKDDSQTAMNWEDSLAWAKKMNEQNYLGYSDWRVPNAKELHTIVDYSRSPQQTNSPAIDDIFNVSSIKREDGQLGYPSYWSSTTHEGLKGGNAAVYISFGEALGYMPDRSKNVSLSKDRKNKEGSKKIVDVHGAGAQRSDPKSGTASRFPQGRGPQGDVIRINNYVRLVRDAK